MIDDYQKALGIDLWTAHYDVQPSLSLSLILLHTVFLACSFFELVTGALCLQRMQEELRKLKEVNSNLRKEIR